MKVWTFTEVHLKLGFCKRSMIQLCYCFCFCESAWFVQQFQFGGNFKNFGEYLTADFVVFLLKKKKGEFGLQQIHILVHSVIFKILWWKQNTSYTKCLFCFTLPRSRINAQHWQGRRGCAGTVCTAAGRKVTAVTCVCTQAQEKGCRCFSSWRAAAFWGVAEDGCVGVHLLFWWQPRDICGAWEFEDEYFPWQFNFWKPAGGTSIRSDITHESKMSHSLSSYQTVHVLVWKIILPYRLTPWTWGQLHNPEGDCREGCGWERKRKDPRTVASFSQRNCFVIVLRLHSIFNYKLCFRPGWNGCHSGLYGKTNYKSLMTHCLKVFWKHCLGSSRTLFKPYSGCSSYF